MELYEVLNKLYSQNDDLILSVINTALHASVECYPRMGRCIHTGFFCRTHKNTLLGFIYCIDDQQLYYQHNNIIPLGTYMFPNQSAVIWGSWINIPASGQELFHCHEYNVNKNSISVEAAKSVIQNNGMIFVNGRNIFSIIHNEKQYSFNIYTPPINMYYCGGTFRFRKLR